MNTWPRWYTRIFGALLVIVGVLGFFLAGAGRADFSVGHAVPEYHSLGWAKVNGWHNLFHILTGVIGLWMLRIPWGPLTYALGFAGFYLAEALWGFAIGEDSVYFGLYPIGVKNNQIHLLFGVPGVVAGLAAVVAGAKPIERVRPARG